MQIFDVLVEFYKIHYNFGAISLLAILAIIAMLMKKNYKWSLIVFIAVIGYNVFLYFKTVDTWGSYTDENGKPHHTCWVEGAEENFANTNVVDKLWASDKAKKMKKQSEERMNQ